MWFSIIASFNTHTRNNRATHSVRTIKSAASLEMDMIRLSTSQSIPVEIIIYRGVHVPADRIERVLIHKTKPTKVKVANDSIALIPATYRFFVRIACTFVQLLVTFHLPGHLKRSMQVQSNVTITDACLLRQLSLRFLYCFSVEIKPTPIQSLCFKKDHPVCNSCFWYGLNVQFK